MALPIPAIAKLIFQLGMLLPPTTKMVEEIRKLVQGPSGNSSINSRLDGLEKAIDLQNSLNERLNKQLEIVQSVLQNVQKSLKLLSAGVILVGNISIVAIFISVIK